VADLTAPQSAALENSDCEVRTDRLTRCLYAVDASIYRVEPAAVAFPRSAGEAAMLLSTAAGSGVEVSPRGAGTGLAGGALGSGLVVDFARHNRRISHLDLEAGTVRVGAGVVLDQLNAFLDPHGLWFGPDVATSSRATLGGMIANNSSGAHAPVYGTTADHLTALEVVLTDGTIANVGAGEEGLTEIRDAADRLLAENSEEIARRLPAGLVKRWPGYGLDRALRSPGDLTQIVAGSEGTLAGVVSAVLRVVPRPARRSLGVIFFASVEEALQATVEISDLEAAAIEHLDAAVFDQTRGQRAFRAARDFLRLDDEPCKAILLVEFFDDDGDRLAELLRRGIGLRSLACTTAVEAELVWGLRRAGLSLVTSRKGPSKPVPGIEDVCVLPERLPEYVAGLRRILEPLGLEASFYGHAASGELHVRPVLDLHRAEDITKLREVADQVSELCRLFKGSLAAEHGVGMARAEYLEAHIGPDLVAASLELKALFDPRGIMNPGKVLGDGRFRIDRDLRLGAGSELRLPFAEAFEWVGRDDGFVANLEQCNGCGGCRKDPPTMCPTFAATGDEALSTRGRANIIRAALEGRFEDPSNLESAELDEVLGTCLACKACATECPSNVDMARLKTELRHARHHRQGVPLTDRMIGSADLLGRLGTIAPGLANRLLGNRAIRRLLQKVFGFDAAAPLPPFARRRFDVWFRRRTASGAGSRGRVILWDDTWVRYHEPGIGRSAVAVLEAAGFTVGLANGRKCCGRPAASRGLLDSVRRSAGHNLRLLAGCTEPIVFLEPSCWSMFRDEYLQLGIEGAEDVAARCVLFEDFLGDLLVRDPDALSLGAEIGAVAVHGHCHAKALSDANRIVGLLERLPGASPKWLETGCCGMAGAFGMLTEHRELSHQVAQPLVRLIDDLPNGTKVVASGTSCRHQIGDLTDARPLHIAELLAQSLERPSQLPTDRAD
jgi:FAD/FMN-containing dehydrogenase/Fe-S oxidoreductase